MEPGANGEGFEWEVWFQGLVYIQFRFFPKQFTVGVLS